MLKGIVVIIGCCLLSPNISAVQAQDQVVDYRYLPARWMTPIGLPGDWHKPVVDQTGGLAYDLGPGPYGIPATTIAVGLSSDAADSTIQTIENSRVPIVKTTTRFGKAVITTEAFSVVPAGAWQFDGDDYSGDVVRVNGLNGSIGWATTGADVDPAFRSVAYGTNRPIDYRLRAGTSPEATVALGFADPYREKDSPVKRVMLANVEGAQTQEVDVVNTVGQNAPFVVLFDAADVNGDGWIDIRIESSRTTVDGNIFVSAIWMFDAVKPIDKQKLIQGALSETAELYVDCGRDEQLRARGPRTELLHAKIDASDDITPVVEIKSRRKLAYDPKNRSIQSNEGIFVETQPKPISAKQTESGWRLEFEKGTDEILIIARNETTHAHRKISELSLEKERLTNYWLETGGIPWDKITISDAGMQALFDGSIRTIYQLTERIDGKIQTQPGPSVYRGLWVSNQPRVGRALTHLGDFETPRSSFERTFEFQQDDGQVLVLSPATLLKETGIAMHAIYIHATMTRDKEFLESYWPKLKKAADWIIRSRTTTTDSTALNFGLLPSGTADGGVGGIVPEYATVYWSLLGMKGVVDGAEWLGKSDDAIYYRAEFADFWAAFRRAARRDMKQDADGNSFLPIRMNFDMDKHVPQRSQTQFSHMVYPGRLFEKDDIIVTGNMAMLHAARKEQGLVVTTGWLTGGLQPFIENTRASARLYLGDDATVHDVLYAIANHAAPTHVWIEEQLPEGRSKATGDVPHSSAAAEFVNLIRYLFVIEDGNHVELFRGVPRPWIYPGARLGVENVPTELGDVTSMMTVSEDGRTVTIQISSTNGLSESGRILVNLKTLKALGYQFAGIPTPDLFGVGLNEDHLIELHRDR